MTSPQRHSTLSISSNHDMAASGVQEGNLDEKSDRSNGGYEGDSIPA